jgi:asparagine synthase (glutamine-hydrolysing)
VCGICGLWAPEGADERVLAAMNETLRHRGPDSDGATCSGPVGLAARRLSIIDLEHGHQPISNEDGSVVVVQNGEIYNHAELAERLRHSGHVFRTRSDTEAIVHLYEEHGLGFAERLRGMFAIAIWDGRERRLVLARDRFGIKPLYWWRRDSHLAFASELKALMAMPGFERAVDPRALESFLAFNSIPGPLTIFRDTQKLLPGHLLVLDEGEPPRVQRFASPTPAPASELRGETPEILAAELRERLRDSVRAHLVSDVPVGVMLSGGVDSAGLAALAAQESGARVSTFSIGFEERSFNELSGARLVAERYGTDHHELVVRPDAAELLPRMAEVFDEPLADSSALPTFLVSQLASDHVKVALSGEGGDELFGGYYTYVADLLAPRVGRAASALSPILNLLPSSSAKVSFDYKAKRFAAGGALPPLERHHAWKEIFSDDLRAQLLAEREPAGIDVLGIWRERYAETDGAEPLARLQDVDLRVYLVDDLLVKTDRASMANSLEARVPYLDSAVAELALALPTRLKVRGLAKKRLLRRALEPLVPGEILKAKKQGFSIPAAAWLRGELEPFAREVLAPDALARQGLLQPELPRRLLDDHVGGRADLSRQLWGLISLTLWFEHWGRPGASGTQEIGGGARTGVGQGQESAH